MNISEFIVEKNDDNKMLILQHGLFQNINIVVIGLPLRLLDKQFSFSHVNVHILTKLWLLATSLRIQ